jgi:hypothetical protein
MKQAAGAAQDLYGQAADAARSVQEEVAPLEEFLRPRYPTSCAVLPGWVLMANGNKLLRPQLDCRKLATEERP